MIIGVNPQQRMDGLTSGKGGRLGKRALLLTRYILAILKEETKLIDSVKISIIVAHSEKNRNLHISSRLI